MSLFNRAFEYCRSFCHVRGIKCQQLFRLGNKKWPRANFDFVLICFLLFFCACAFCDSSWGRLARGWLGDGWSPSLIDNFSWSNETKVPLPWRQKRGLELNARGGNHPHTVFRSNVYTYTSTSSVGTASAYSTVVYVFALRIPHQPLAIDMGHEWQCDDLNEGGFLGGVSLTGSPRKINFTLTKEYVCFYFTKMAMLYFNDPLVVSSPVDSEGSPSSSRYEFINYKLINYNPIKHS